jgi:hypothetical protein
MPEGRRICMWLWSCCPTVGSSAVFSHLVSMVTEQAKLFLVTGVSEEGRSRKETGIYVTCS